MCTIQTFAIEKNEREVSDWHSLNSEIRNQILNEVCKCRTSRCAIKNLKNMLTTQKDFISDKETTNYLDATLTQFPGSEIRITNLLRRPIGDAWLNKKRMENKQPSYKRISTNNEETTLGLKALIAGLTHKNFYQALHEWLECGHDPAFLADYPNAILDLGLPNNCLYLSGLLFKYGADLSEIDCKNNQDREIYLENAITDNTLELGYFFEKSEQGIKKLKYECD